MCLKKYIRRIVFATVIFVSANAPLLKEYLSWWSLMPVLLLAICTQLVPAWEHRTMPLLRHRVCAGGCELLIYFLISTAGSAVFMLAKLGVVFSEGRGIWLWNLACCVLVEGLTFWNGILRVYACSAQIGIKWRVIGILCGWIPIVNLFALWKILKLASCECQFESRKIQNNQMRKVDRLCETRYPILLVHGVFFRDSRYLNYWGRIPGELEKNGAPIYYGNHQSAASVADSGKELSKRIYDILKETGADKVNIIAHSKGGLDCRYAISMMGMGDCVASLTTINTPHRGCQFADYLLGAIPVVVKEKVARGYNLALKKLGDQNPDFMAAVNDLTASACARFNQQVKDVPGVFYQSVGSRLKAGSGGRFPLSFSYVLVKHFDGSNDGLVAEESFPWGADFILLTTAGKRGISHGDMIDLNRENIADFDVREFYVKLVHGLKEKGY